MRRAFASFFIIAFFIANSAHAKIVVTASVTPAAATVGDRLTYEIRVTAGKQTAQVKPEPFLGDTAPFELIDAKAVSVDEQTHKLVFTLALFEAGKFQLPVYTLHWMDSDNNLQSVSSEPVFVEILSVLKQGQKEPENLDISPVAQAVLDWREYLLPSALTVALLAAVAAFIWWWKKRPKHQLKVKEQRIVSPKEAALGRLADLEQKNLPRSGQLKRYFTELSDTLREYLEKEFGLDAMERTTFELETELPDLLKGQRVQIISLLKICDSVKFAKAVLEPEDSDRALAETREIIITASKINENKSGVTKEMETEKLSV